jgi:hypothetical protein
MLKGTNCCNSVQTGPTLWHSCLNDDSRGALDA